MIKVYPPQSTDENLQVLVHDLRNTMTTMYCSMEVLERILSKRSLKSEVKIVHNMLKEIREMDLVISEHLPSSSLVPRSQF